MRTLLTVCIVSTLACNPACGGAQAIERQVSPAAACLPAAAAAILGCVKAHDEACVIIQVAELVACWTTHQPPPPDSGTPSVVHASYDDTDGAPSIVQLTARVSTPSPFPGGAPTLEDFSVGVHVDITADASTPVLPDASAGFDSLWSAVVSGVHTPIAQTLRGSYNPYWIARSVASLPPSPAPAVNAATSIEWSKRSLNRSPRVMICPAVDDSTSIASPVALAITCAMSSPTSAVMAARLRPLPCQSSLTLGPPGGGPLGTGIPGSGSWSAIGTPDSDRATS